MNPERLRSAEATAIATTTFYNPNSDVDKSRAEISRGVIRNMHDLGYNVVVVDGGSSDEFLDSIIPYCQLFNENPRGMGNGRRQAVRECLETSARVIAWTEPEKDSYIPELHKTVIPILNGNAELVFPSRANLDNYPISQQYAEKFAIQTMKNLTGRGLDYWFGPKTWSRKVSTQFLDYQSKCGDKWDSILLPFLGMIKAGVKTMDVPVNYDHPTQQTIAEEGDVKMDLKRLEQLNNLIPAAIEYWNSLDK